MAALTPLGLRLLRRAVGPPGRPPRPAPRLLVRATEPRGTRRLLESVAARWARPEAGPGWPRALFAPTPRLDVEPVGPAAAYAEAAAAGAVGKVVELRVAGRAGEPSVAPAPPTLRPSTREQAARAAVPVVPRPASPSHPVTAGGTPDPGVAGSGAGDGPAPPAPVPAALPAVADARDPGVAEAPGAERPAPSAPVPAATPAAVGVPLPPAAARADAGRRQRPPRPVPVQVPVTASAPAAPELRLEPAPARPARVDAPASPVRAAVLPGAAAPARTPAPAPRRDTPQVPALPSASPSAADAEPAPGARPLAPPAVPVVRLRSVLRELTAEPAAPPRGRHRDRPLAPPRPVRAEAAAAFEPAAGRPRAEGLEPAPPAGAVHAHVPLPSVESPIAAPPQQPLDVHRIADDVYVLLATRLAEERDRRGL